MKTSKWDMAEFMETKEDIIAHLKVALEENDIDFLLSIINALVHDNNPAFGTVVKTLDNLGFKLNIELKQVS